MAERKWKKDKLLIFTNYCKMICPNFKWLLCKGPNTLKTWFLKTVQRFCSPLSTLYLILPLWLVLITVKLWETKSDVLNLRFYHIYLRNSGTCIWVWLIFKNVILLHAQSCCILSTSKDWTRLYAFPTALVKDVLDSVLD